MVELPPPLPGPPPLPAPPPPAGWYADPWGSAPWRWWDGRGWTGYTAGVPGAAGGARPQLPAWISAPIAAAGAVVFPLLGFTVLAVPLAAPLALVPLLIVLPVLVWLDRVEPEPRAALVHALLWGATVAVLVAVIVNTVTAVTLGDAVAAVVSAPIVEEGVKGLGVLWAVRRREVDGVMDGIVYAGWVAIGFAVVEDVEYFALADTEGALLATFVVRGLLTPFAHPLFTMWIGLAVGRAVARRRPLGPAFVWGWAVAAATHAAWNGSLVLADALDQAAVVAVAFGLFVLLFLGTAVMLARARRAQERQLTALVPVLATRYRMPAAEVEVFTDWRRLLEARKRLPRPERKRFDAMHQALARLAELHGQPPPLDREREQVLAAQLARARIA